ncbi:hypothetical protein [Leifsonia poae]|uniref:Uncharacterized protein n=1 Tax=Leifsonia poae TaxID=110933 RepID=A0A9W6H8M8_9MICO|nr:hypothetical protein [Leifsonia poae]GLJ75727.1 hypothetical protein GCM10017584_13010 [Leifsonia poae]
MERGEAWIVRHGGREYITSDEMARIFLSQAEQAVRTGEPTLVVLRHSKGVELVLVTDESSFTVARRHAAAVDEIGHARHVLH